MADRTPVPEWPTGQIESAYGELDRAADLFFDLDCLVTVMVDKLATTATPGMRETPIYFAWLLNHLPPSPLPPRFRRRTWEKAWRATLELAEAAGEDRVMMRRNHSPSLDDAPRFGNIDDLVNEVLAAENSYKMNNRRPDTTATTGE